MKRKAADTKALLRDVLDVVTDGVVVFGPDDRLVMCNERYREIYAPIADHLAPGTLCEDLYRAWGDLGLFDLKRGSVEAQIAERVARHRDPQGPFELHTSELSIRVEERITADGFIIGVHADITQRKRTADALRLCEKRLREFEIRNADRFWTMDANLRFTTLVDYPNSHIDDSPNNYIGRTRWEAAGVDPDTDENWRRHRDDLLARKPFSNFTYATKDEDGRTYQMSVSGTPVFDEAGVFTGYHGTTIKITDQMQDQEKPRNNK